MKLRTPDIFLQALQLVINRGSLSLELPQASQLAELQVNRLLLTGAHQHHPAQASGSVGRLGEYFVFTRLFNLDSL